MKICLQCGDAFLIPDEDLKFLSDIAPVIGGKKIEIPPPTLCRLCRLQRRLLFRNERTLYKKNCDVTGKPLLTVFSPPYKVYSKDYWWSDAWDASLYGRNFDFNKTLAEQLKQLSLNVPHSNVYQTNCENSEYCNQSINFKNCYLIFGGGNDENCLYGKFVVDCHNCMDTLSITQCEWCYEAAFSNSCYQCQFITHCRNCSDSMFLDDCLGCRNCLLCFGLRNKEYCVLNKYVGKDRFEAMKKELEPLTSEKIKLCEARLKSLKEKLPHQAMHIYASENCTGDLILNSKNCQWSFDIKNGEDCRYINFGPNNLKSYDCTFNAPQGVKFCYEMCSTAGLENSIGCFLSWYGDSNFYSMECQSCNHVFACIGMQHKSYCILNKQYSKEEYENLVPKIIDHLKETGEWGEFLNPLVSTFGYNETIAQEYFPMNRDEALKKGFLWKDGEALPQTQTSTEEKIYSCQQCSKAFKLIDSEIKFYEKMKLPIPMLCHTCRHMKRIQIRPSFKLFDRSCASCGKSVKSIYTPAQSNTVYCEQCYEKIVY